MCAVNDDHVLTLICTALMNMRKSKTADAAYILKEICAKFGSNSKLLNIQAVCCMVYVVIMVMAMMGRDHKWEDAEELLNESLQKV